uniref:RxLR effector protein n=1 Tax=Rhabditophanes sp. KR3021 TaxID=114890 RepID=A0AC35TMI9_9BILA
MKLFGTTIICSLLVGQAIYGFNVENRDFVQVARDGRSVKEDNSRFKRDASQIPSGVNNNSITGSQPPSELNVSTLLSAIQQAPNQLSGDYLKQLVD